MELKLQPTHLRIALMEAPRMALLTHRTSAQTMTGSNKNYKRILQARSVFEPGTERTVSQLMPCFKLKVVFSSYPRCWFLNGLGLVM